MPVFDHDLSDAVETCLLFICFDSFLGDGREAYYYIGRHLFLAGRFDEALQDLLRCDEVSRRIDKNGSSGFLSMTNLMIGMIYDVQKKRGSALAQYQKVLEMKEYESTHKEAHRYTEKPYTRAQ